MPDQPTEPPLRQGGGRHSPDGRDDGIFRIGTITRWLVAGSVAGVGLFAGLAAASTPRLDDHPDVDGA